jgi:tetratricopeptide (TPR) repeat protein
MLALSTKSGDRFDLLLNPFVLLGVSLTATARDISRAYEDAVDTNRVEIDRLQRCRQILLTPALRIDAELSGLFDVGCGPAAQLMRKLQAEAGREQLEDQIGELGPLPQSNVRAHLLSRAPGRPMELLALAQAQAEIAAAAVHDAVRKARNAAKCGQIELDGVVEALNRLQERQAKAAIDRLLEDSGYADTFTAFVRRALSTGHDALIAKLDLFVRAYKNAVLPELSRRKEQVAAACAAIRDDCKDRGAIDRLLQALRRWHEIGEPLEMFEGHLHRDEPYTREIYEQIRPLCVWVNDKQKEYEVPLTITLACVEIFKALPRAVAEMREHAGIYSANLGNGHMERGNLDRAIAAYDQAIQLNPKNGIAYNQRGVCYRRRGDLDRAIGDFDEAIRSDPNNAIQYANRADCYEQKKSYDRAIRDYDEAIRLNPDYLRAYNDRGICYYWKGDYARAIRDYDQALRLDPSHELARQNRAAASEKLGGEALRTNARARRAKDESANKKARDAERNASLLSTNVRVSYGEPTNFQVSYREAAGRREKERVVVQGPWGPPQPPRRKSAGREALFWLAVVAAIFLWFVVHR